ncbi:MAG: hypothetical protein ACI30I_06765 [Parabacteroides sp.]
MMKRCNLYLILYNICLLFWTNSDLYADTKDPRGNQSVDRKDVLYLQLYGGINKSANEHLPMSEFSSHPWSGGAFFGIGEEFNALWGWRAALRINHNKSRNVPACESADTWDWNSVGLFGDGTFDITDAFAKPNQPEGRFNVKAFAGVGIVYAYDYPEDVILSYAVPYSTGDRVIPAARAGVDVSYKIDVNWRVGMELSHTLFTDKFNAVKTGAPMDMRTNLKVGVTYLFGEPNRPVTPSGPVIYDSRLRTVPWLPFLLPEAEETKVRRIMGRAFLDFPVNEMTIYPQYRRNPEELERMQTTIEHALFDKSFQVLRVTLHGYASPESPYSNNTRLARGRTQSLKEYVCAQFQIPESIVETTFTPEDWDNLRAFIETRGNSRRVKGDIWYEHETVIETPAMPDYVLEYREELLGVIDSPMEPDEKEARLKYVGGGQPYRWLLQYVYPGLRHTDYVIEYVVKHYEVKDARRLIYTHPEALSVEEIYQVAKSYGEGTDGWLDALVTAALQYPDDPTANLNAVSACVQMKRLTDAKRFLAKAGSSMEASYLSDVIRAMEGSVKWRMEEGKVIIITN